MNRNRERVSPVTWAQVLHARNFRCARRVWDIERHAAGHIGAHGDVGAASHLAAHPWSCRRPGPPRERPD